jgi:hypothetical protein
MNSCTSTSPAKASPAASSVRAFSRSSAFRTNQTPRLAEPTDVLITVGSRIAPRNCCSDVTIEVAGCGRPISSSNQLKPALLCAVR